MNNSSEIRRKLEGSLGAAIIGALCGGMVAAFAAAISGSPLSMSITVAIAGFLGCQVRGLRGLIAGLVFGILIVAFGSVIASSFIGVVFVIVAGASLGAWKEWHRKPVADLNSDWCYRFSGENDPHEDDREPIPTEENSDDEVFYTARPFENPQFARWQFLRRTGRSDRRAPLPSEVEANRLSRHRRQGT
ncbi:MAG: hypothetical protein IT428_25430 [Planctomycetaceae bacterium]|nr:hypothetical protein [Planctomycetaceae bacterium]